MSRMKQRAKLLPNLLGTRSKTAAGISPSTFDAMYQQHMLFKKGAASALGFRPSYWSHDPNTQDGDPRRRPVPVSIPKSAQACTAVRESSAGETNYATEPNPPEIRVRATEDRVAQQALAASLAEIIESMLSTRKFGTVSV
jgi:hypothetical protein